jgi:hypothetical protein
MFVNEFLVGADPEFVIVDGDSTLKQVKEEREFEIAAGKMGPDHGGYVAELRPTPARSTYTLVKRIQKLLNAPHWTETERQYKWLAGPVQEVTTPAVNTPTADAAVRLAATAMKMVKATRSYSLSVATSISTFVLTIQHGIRLLKP